jgi:hypothetical protein
MAPCLYHYGSDRNKVPYYGDTGLNAGIMHMDLDRYRMLRDRSRKQRIISPKPELHI